MLHFDHGKKCTTNYCKNLHFEIHYRYDTGPNDLTLIIWVWNTLLLHEVKWIKKTDKLSSVIKQYKALVYMHGRLYTFTLIVISVWSHSSKGDDAWGLMTVNMLQSLVFHSCVCDCLTYAACFLCHLQTVEHGFPHQPSALSYSPSLELLAIGTRSGAIKLYPSWLYCGS